MNKSKQFFNKVLSGTATGIIIGLIPNAVISTIVKLFSEYSFAVTIGQSAVIFQLATPFIIGALIAYQFKLDSLSVMVVGGAAFIGSGVIKFDATIAEKGGFIGLGTGDIINTMLTATLAILVIQWIGQRLGSVAIILVPIVAGIGAGTIGHYLYPYTTMISTAIGDGINTFTTLQPVLMSMLISCSFAFLILSPISTVAIGVAIQLQGVSAGAAAMGVAATTIVLVINSFKVNKPGIIAAIALGAMKMMMPNLFRKPIILLPCFFTALISAIPVALFSISGTPASAGFGLVGLIGPLTSIDLGLNVGLAMIFWFLVPIISALLAQLIFEKIFKLYSRKDVFEFLG